MFPAGFPAGATARQMQKALPTGVPFVFWLLKAIRVPAILRFPNPSEIKTSPKSCRRLPLLDLADGILWMLSIRGGINHMATKDDFQPDRSPIFLSGHAEETEQPDIGKAWNIATISSRILKTSIVAA